MNYERQNSFEKSVAHKKRHTEQRQQQNIMKIAFFHGQLKLYVVLDEVLCVSFSVSVSYTIFFPCVSFFSIEIIHLTLSHRIIFARNIGWDEHKFWFHLILNHWKGLSCCVCNAYYACIETPWKACIAVNNTAELTMMTEFIRWSLSLSLDTRCLSGCLLLVQHLSQTWD